MMKWLRVGGYIFFRESCFHQSGDCKRKSNPTHYREPRFYTKVFSCLTSVHFVWFDCCFCISRINHVSSFVLHYSVCGSVTDVDFYICLTLNVFTHVQGTEMRSNMYEHCSIFILGTWMVTKHPSMPSVWLTHFMEYCPKITVMWS